MKTLNIIWKYTHLTGLYWADNIWPDPDPMTDDTHYTNHLITETSPDLLQHALNPVNGTHGIHRHWKRHARETT